MLETTNQWKYGKHMGGDHGQESLDQFYPWLMSLDWFKKLRRKDCFFFHQLWRFPVSISPWLILRSVGQRLESSGEVSPKSGLSDKETTCSCVHEKKNLEVLEAQFSSVFLVINDFHPYHSADFGDDTATPKKRPSSVPFHPLWLGKTQRPSWVPAARWWNHSSPG